MSARVTQRTQKKCKVKSAALKAQAVICNMVNCIFLCAPCGSLRPLRYVLPQYRLHNAQGFHLSEFADVQRIKILVG
jgi:hypothetical protein